MNKKFYITTAIAYPNSAPHLGHALEIIQADVLARFYRLAGKDVFFQTGTDEHGIKNWQAAQKEGKKILEFLDNNVSMFKQLYDKLQISHDNFIRTSDKKAHYPGAIKLWNELVRKGDIYKKPYKGLYCAGCEAFKTEKELKKGKCPNHPTRQIDLIEEENYFFRLSKYKDVISKKIKSDEFQIIPKTRKNEIISFLKDANDVSFSRPKSSLPWGIPIPKDESQVMYVWCDALSNYITGIDYGTDEKNFKKYWPADIQVIGKDILRFHAAFWPAMLISAELELPKKLFVHGFILSKGEKMAKSTGNVIEPFSQIEKYGINAFRFYMVKSMPLDGDGDYSENLIIEIYNKELAENIGNFCYRVLSFINNNFDGEINGIEKDDKIIDAIIQKISAIKQYYEEFNFNMAINEILLVSGLGNKYFQENEPWKLIKNKRAKSHKICGLCINIAKIISILLYPILPDFCSEIQKQLNLKNLSWKDLDFSLNKHKIGKEKILLNKIESGIFEEFPLDLRVARILSVSEHPNADNLYILKINLGAEKRQIVAGLKNYYSKEMLEGRNIILVCNMKHAKLRGIVSEGMLLAADNGKDVGILTSNDEVGSIVNFGNLENSKKEISFENFLKIKMTVKDGKVYYSNNILKTAKGQVEVDKIKDDAIIR